MSKFDDLYKKIIMQQLDGVDPNNDTEEVEEIENTEETENVEEVNETIKTKVEDFIVDELEDLPESEWRDKLDEIVSLVIEKIDSDDPISEIDNMDYLDFGNLIKDAMTELDIDIDNDVE